MLLMSFIRLAERPVERAIAHLADLTGIPKPKRKIKLGTTARAVLLIPEFIFIGIVCWPQIKLFSDSLADGGYFYVLFVFLVFLMLAFLQGFLPVFQKHNRGGALLAMNLSVTFSFLYLSTLAYAYHIYPYLPSSRGGGDYSADPRVCLLTFNSDAITSIPDSLIENRSLQSKPLTLLEESPTLVFVTPECTFTERARWRRVGVENKPKVIYTIQRDAITTISFQDFTTGPAPSPTPYPRALTPPVPVPAATPTPALSPSSLQSPVPTTTPSADAIRSSGVHKRKPSARTRHQ
jgi:hypothetical protein